jgi:hypothetical protein
MKLGHWLLLGSLSALGACKPRAFNTNGDDGAQSLAWAVKSQAWAATDEQGFSDWIKKIGEARAARKCTAIAQCIAAVPPGNLAPEKLPYEYKPDCGRLAYLLRSYYAYRMQLPFSFQSYMAPEGTKDVRYTEFGNTVVGHNDQSKYPTLAKFFQSGYGGYGTPNYRVPAVTDATSPNAFADIYPVSIDRNGIRPGVVYYDPNGHVAMVVDVKTNGTIVTWNGHPDGTDDIRDFDATNFPGKPTRSKKFGGFLRFRGWKAVGNLADVKAVPNPEQPNFSMEQYGAWNHQGKEYTDFYKWVRVRMGGTDSIDPVAEFKRAVADLCSKLVDRVKPVQQAFDEGVAQLPHPGLPPNIYGAEGPWERHSTPGGADMRAKLAYMSLYQLVSNSLSQVAANNRTEYAFAGSASDLAKTYLALWNQSKTQPQCMASAKNSAGQPIVITIESGLKSIFDWSFDPYHCPELRWGFVGTPTCPNDPVKQDIYQKEAKLRWNTNKDPSPTTITNYEFGNFNSRPPSDFMPILMKYNK